METERRKPPTRSSSGSAPASTDGLGSFLDSAPKAKISRGSATVSGPLSAEEGEIYIRPDGKKVRRVKRVVAKSSTDSAATPSNAGLGSFLDDGALRTPKKKASGSATVTGYTPSKKVGSKSAEEGEIYIRADGKKVRRVKRAVASGSASVAPTSSNSANKGLGGFLDSGATSKPKMSGSATVTGYTPSKINKLGSASAASSKDDGEIYIRADGKKVRRVKKTITATEKAAATTAASAEEKDDMARLSKEERKKKNLQKFLDSSAKKSGGKKKKGSSATVTGFETEESDDKKEKKKDLDGFLSTASKGAKKKKGGAASVSGVPSSDIKLSKSAEDFAAKYRKKKKTPGATTEDTKSVASSGDEKPNPKGLGGFLDAGTTTKPKMSGSATVGGPPTRKLGSASGSSSKDDGEIYIRADGKRVRRVRKTVSADDSATVSSGSSPAEKPSLGGFLDTGATNKPKMSGSATVTGYNPSKAKSTGSKDEGEIYIRADGKKVRRIRKTKSSDDADPEAAKAAGGLGGFLGSQESIKKPLSGSATVTGAPVSTKSLEGEIYINAAGKRVRRVRKSPASSSAGDLAETSSTNSASPGPKPGLSGFLDTNTAAKPKMSGSATVTGYNPSKATKATSSTAQEGEIYIRPDGKKVRRIRKQKPSDDGAGTVANGTGPSTAAALASDPKPKNNGAATVAGETVIKVTPEGEIVLRADGKKVLRRKKTGVTGDAATPAATDNSEVYRRADGKLVRRVRKGAKGPSSAGDLAGFLGTANANKARADGDIATVTGDARPKTSIEDLMKYKTQKTALPAIDPNIDVSKLTAEQFAIAGSYRIMLQQGLSKEQVHSRMEQDRVEKIIISAVLSEDTSMSPRRSSMNLGSTGISALSGDDNEIAERYRKMLKMGMPSDAVRNKMTMDGIAENIVADVLGDMPPISSMSPSDGSSAQNSKLSAEEEALAATYRKMLKMGLPPDAVKHKMVQDGVSRVVIVAVVGEVAAGSADPAAENTTEGKENTPEMEEDPIASRFRKMLKMGLPPDAVRAKMNSEGVDEAVIQAVLGNKEESPAATESSAPAVGSNLSADDEAVATKYRKMFKMGLPEDAVRQKMNMDGVAPNIIASVMGEDTPTVLTPDDEAAASKYRKMLKMGLPEDAVKQKMDMDGVAGHVITAVLGGGEDVAEPAMAPPPVVASSALSPEQEEIASKFRKMFKMGLPEDAVKHKMVQDGVEQSIIDVVIGGGASPAPVASIASGSAVAPPPPANSGESQFVVVMGHDHNPTSPPIATASAPLDPNEKFAVDVDPSGEKKLDGEVETRFMTLEDIAKATGQDPEKLKEMVKDRRSNSATMPRFVLTPVNPKPAQDVFEVAVPKAATGAAAPSDAALGVPSLGGPSMKDAGLDPRKHYKEVNDGQEVVDTKLANAARAVSALGDMDMKSLLEQLKQGEMHSLIAKLEEAEKRQKKLEKQLAQAGVAIAEDIDYGEAKVKVAQIAKRMGEIGGSDVVHPDKEEQNRLREEYFKLEQEMERYNTALMLTDEYQKEQDRIERKWEEDNAPGNLEALKKIRRHMPVKIRHMSEAELCNTPSPNGKFLPKATAKKFKRTNVLQAIRLNPDDLERMHPSTLENMRVTGLTLTERRALYCHLKPLGPKWEKNKAEKMTERKWTWYQMMKNNFKENLAPYNRHVAQYGPPENHVGCPLLGKQCPIKADKLIDYDGDYGWPDGDEYEVSDVKKADVDDPGAKAKAEALELAKEKKANERADLLKKHYKGKLLQVSKANGSCESMDEAMDKMEFGLENWIEFKLDKGDKIVEADMKKEVANFTEGLNTLKLQVLNFVQRSGMQTSGKRKAGGDAEDIRSAVEASLADEVWECSQVYFKFIRERMQETKMRDTRVEKTIELLEGMLGELHGKNEALLKKLGTERRERSRELKETAKIQKEAEEKIKARLAAEQAEAGGGGEEEEDYGGGPPAGPPGGGGGRGGLLDAIKGGRGRGGGGRGGLLDAIKGGRGRGGGGRGGLLDAIKGGRGRGGGGRGGLLDAIKGGRGRGGGGRGGLLDAIKGGRGRGGGRGGGDGGRGGLMAAIAARGGGGDGGGGRGGLMAAIAARGAGRG
mmetsp:Transcript_15018/g.28687  ORF Transcript_15018/g.28687 Transcript_15018/m.28687 type:complete len:2096 (-) Transcript_15018:105-6392(-)